MKEFHKPFLNKYGNEKDSTVNSLNLWGGRLTAQKHNPKYLRENDKAFETITKRTTSNGFIEFKEEAKVAAADFFTKYAQNLGLGQHYELQLTKDETDKLQIRHQRYQLYYKKIVVEGAEFTLHSKEGILLSANGRIVENMDFDLSKPMPEQRALELALADKNLTKADFFRPWWCSHRQALLTV